MSRLSFAILVTYMFVGCCANKQLASDTHDDVRTEVRERIVYRDTVIYVEVSHESQSQTVRDTTSHLETSVAVSDARINSDGTLTHSLENKPIFFGINFKMPELRRDSIVYRNFYRTNTVEVPRPLTWWQQTKMKGFWIMLTILAFLLLRKHFLKYIRALFK